MPWTNTLYRKQDAKDQTNFGLVKKLTLFLQEGWWGCSKRHSRGGDQTDQNFCCLHGGKPGSYLPQIFTVENNTYICQFISSFIYSLKYWQALKNQSSQSLRSWRQWSTRERESWSGNAICLATSKRSLRWSTSSFLSFFEELDFFFFLFLRWWTFSFLSFFEVANFIFISLFWGYELLFSFIYWGDKDIQRWQYPRIIEVIFFFLLVMTIYIMEVGQRATTAAFSTE